MWLWLGWRPAAAALIQPLAWELPYAGGVTLKKKKKKWDPVVEREERSVRQRRNKGEDNGFFMQYFYSALIALKLLY